MLHEEILYYSKLALLKQLCVYAFAMTKCNDEVTYSNFPSSLVLVCCVLLIVLQVLKHIGF